MEELYQRQSGNLDRQIIRKKERKKKRRKKGLLQNSEETF